MKIGDLVKIDDYITSAPHIGVICEIMRAPPGTICKVLWVGVGTISTWLYLDGLTLFSEEE